MGILNLVTKFCGVLFLWSLTLYDDNTISRSIYIQYPYINYTLKYLLYNLLYCGLLIVDILNNVSNILTPVFLI